MFLFSHKVLNTCSRKNTTQKTLGCTPHSGAGRQLSTFWSRPWLGASCFWAHGYDPFSSLCDWADSQHTERTCLSSQALLILGAWLASQGGEGLAVYPLGLGVLGWGCRGKTGRVLSPFCSCQQLSTDLGSLWSVELARGSPEALP